WPRRHAVARFLQRAAGLARQHADAADPDAVLARIAHQLRRRIEAHRLAVEHRGEEGGRLVPLDPAADVGELGEARRMALGKAVLAEALDLPEDAVGEIGRIAFVEHAVDDPRLERPEPALALPGRHRPA